MPNAFKAASLTLGGEGGIDKTPLKPGKMQKKKKEILTLGKRMGIIAGLLACSCCLCSCQSIGYMLERLIRIPLNLLNAIIP